MRRPWSLTGRLVATLTAGAMALWLLSAGIAALTLRAQLDAAYDGGLRETAERLLPLAAQGRDDGDGDGPFEAPYFDASPETLVYQLRNRDGGVLMRSHSAPLVGFNAPLKEGFVSSDGLRVYTLGSPDGRVFIQVGEALGDRMQSLWGSIIALLWPLAVLAPLSALGIWLAVRSGLRPLDWLREEVARRDASNLAPIDERPLPVELAPVGQAVRELIDRLRAALEAERAFAANSAHELRTPIAGSLAQTQRLIEELDPGPARTRAARIEEALQKLQVLAEKLMQLSRADAGMARHAERQDLLPALRLVAADLGRTRAGTGRLRVDVARDATLAASIDLDAFGIALRNLIENALLHGGDGEVMVSVPRDGVVEVINGGSPVSAEALPNLTQRFQRAGSEAPGSGLGLSIVRTIVEQAGGTLELLSPAPGRPDGFLARMSFG